jgi:hypothetical protein
MDTDPAYESLGKVQYLLQKNINVKNDYMFIV